MRINTPFCERLASSPATIGLRDLVPPAVAERRRLCLSVAQAPWAPTSAAHSISCLSRAHITHALYLLRQHTSQTATARACPPCTAQQLAAFRPAHPPASVASYRKHARRNAAAGADCRGVRCATGSCMHGGRFWPRCIPSKHSACAITSAYAHQQHWSAAPASACQRNRLRRFATNSAWWQRRAAVATMPQHVNRAASCLAARSCVVTLRATLRIKLTPCCSLLSPCSAPCIRQEPAASVHRQRA